MGKIIWICVGAVIVWAGTILLMRKQYSDKKEAAVKAISKSLLSILTSGSILIMAGYTIHFTSTIRSISQIGHFVGRGALLSTVLVLTLLPALLSLFDKKIISRINKKEEKKHKKLLEKQKQSHRNNDSAAASEQ